MKKKIFLMLTMCALLVCLFVISASALNPVIYNQLDNFSDFSSSLSSLYFYSMKSVNGYEDTFSIYSDTTLQILIIDIDEFKSYCNKYNLKSYDDLANKVSTFDTTTYEGYEYVNFITDILNSPGPDIFNYFYNYTESSGGASEEELEAKYQEGFEDGKQSGYTEGYSKGMFDFAQEEKDLIEGYYSLGGEFTANGLNEFISSFSSETFRDIYNSLGTESIYNLLEDNFSSSSSSSSHGGSSVTVTQQGENYGKSHEGDISSDCCYNPGYVDGVADGGTIYKGSDSYQADITNEINSYMRSEEYQTLMNEYSAQVVESYIDSIEYKSAIDSSFVAGQEAGEADAWEKAKDEVLAEGVRQGYLNYKGSQEYKDAIDSSKTAGYLDGVEDGKNSVVDPSGVLILFAIAIFLGIIIFAIHKKVRSKRRR